MRHISDSILPLAMVLAMVLAFCGPADLNAWEIQLKSRVAVTSAVVRLHDIATIVDVEEPTRSLLQRIVIAPAPTRSFTR